MRAHDPGLATHELLRRDGELHLAGIPVKDLAQTTGTPAFVYVDSLVARGYDAVVSSFAMPSPWDVMVYYSAKTAPEPRLLSLLRSRGACVEVACVEEMEKALACGIDPGRIMLDGPAHSADTVRHAASRGVRRIKVDSLDQLRLVTECGRDASLSIVLRLRAPASRLAQSPAEALLHRFGVARPEWEECWAHCAAHPQTPLEGLAIHVGSQVAGTKPYRKAVAILAEASRRSWQAGLRPLLIDVGGGFPSSTLHSPSVAGVLRLITGRAQAPPLTAFGREVRVALAEEILPETVRTLAVEPGRIVAGSAAVLLTRVVAVKDRWVFVDASRNFVPESLFFAQRRFLPVRAGGPLSRVNLAGCTLSGGDVLALGARLPRCARGDLLVMLDAGAYTLSKASRFTTPLPAVYAIAEDGALEAVRSPEGSHAMA